MRTKYKDLFCRYTLAHTKWRLKQLLPLTYVSTFIENEQPKIEIWKMWFGRSYNIRTYLLKEYIYED